MITLRRVEWFAVFILVASTQHSYAADSLKVHGVFRSNMVLQRDKPITVWGWAPLGSEVHAVFGESSAATKANDTDGRWEVVFEAQPANSEGQGLTVKSRDRVIETDNILIGDVWVGCVRKVDKRQDI